MKRSILMLALLVSLTLVSHQAGFCQAVDSAKVITVSNNGSGADYTNLAAAVANRTTQTEILVYPGVYTGPNNYNITWPSGVALRGVDRATTIIRGGDGSFDSGFLFDLYGATDVTISNITLDGSNVASGDNAPWEGAISVCNADRILLDGVTYINDRDGYYSRSSLTSLSLNMGCGSTGTITVRNADIAAIANFDGHWEVYGSRLHARSQPNAFEAEVVTAFLNIPSYGETSVKIVGSVLESVALAGHDVLKNYALYVEGSGTRIEISGSTLIARTEEDSPSYVTTPIGLVDSSVDLDQPVIVDGSILRYESVEDAASGSFHGVYVEGGEDQTRAVLHIQGSSIVSVGSGGTRSDIDIDADSPVVVGSTAYSTVSGDSIDFVSAPDERQAWFSADLTIPITAPTLAAPADGQIWIDDATNKFCYRSNGTTRCLLGTTP